jgi:hypothetical protein
VGNKTKKRTLHCEEHLNEYRIRLLIHLDEPLSCRIKDMFCIQGLGGIIAPMTYWELKRQSTPFARATVIRALLDNGYGEHIERYLTGGCGDDPADFRVIPVVVQGLINKVLSDLGKETPEDVEFLKNLGVGAQFPG